MEKILFKSTLKFFALTGIIFGMISSASATPITETEPNDSIATAHNIDSFFDLSFDINIENSVGVNTSTLIPHVEIQGLISNTASFDYYSFLGTAGSTAIFDIDCGWLSHGSNCTSLGNFDTYLRLFDPSGASIATDDDSFLSVDTGSGSVGTLDSYIELILPNTGLYAIRVGRCCEGPIFANSDYILNVSVANHQNTDVPEPAPLALLGLGLLGLGFARKRRA